MLLSKHRSFINHLTELLRSYHHNNQLEIEESYLSIIGNILTTIYYILIHPTIKIFILKIISDTHGFL